MSQVDIAGAVQALSVVGHRVATVAVQEFVFKHPVRTGDLLSFYAGVERIGRTSITVRVVVLAQRLGAQREYTHVTDAVLTYVAIDDQGQPRVISQA